MSDLPAPIPRSFGPDGTRFAPLAWGMWRLAENGRNVADATKLVYAALDAGITLLDTADIYGFNGESGFGDAETMLGQVFASEPSLRARIVLSSKGGIRPPLPYDQSPTYLVEAIDASLHRLRVERIDLWHIHRPDILTHPQEVARALDAAVDAGKIGALAVSNFTLHQTAALNQFLDNKLTATQPEISPLRITCFEDGTLDQAMTMGLVPLAWSPLGGGRLADPQSERERAVAAALDVVATEQGVSRTVAAYSWLMAHPAGIVPIIGSQQPARIAEAAQALGVRWSRESWYAVLVAARGEKLP